jgi:hypothetical protein
MSCKESSRTSSERAEKELLAAVIIKPSTNADKVPRTATDTVIADCVSLPR